jgi:hydroxyacylglutathione hydrolase
MQIKTFPVGMLSTNCYVMSCLQTKEAIIIDPGVDYLSETKQIFDYVQDASLQVKFIVNTHGHHDHIGGNPAMMQKYDSPLCIHENDLHYITDDPKQKLAIKPVLLKDGDTITFGNINLKVMHTPGHSRGSICLIGHTVAFTGDTLFSDGIGRTDFEGGSDIEIVASLKKLARLPDSMVIYPGHMETSTIGKEKQFNPYL